MKGGIISGGRVKVNADLARRRALRRAVSAHHKAGMLLSMASQNPMTLGSHRTMSGR
jgi:hypothetical protein